MKNTEQHTFPVSLTAEAHRIAQEFYSGHAQPQQAKRVYLNTLSIQAVDFYLKCLGVETDLEQSQSWNPTMQVLSNTADLWVTERGRLECRPVLPGMQECLVPMEVRDDRIGYIFVQLNAELTEATLLGFLPAIASETVSLSDLHSLHEFPRFLSQVQQEKTAGAIVLSHWFKQLFDAGWETWETIWQPLAAAPLAYQFRQPVANDTANLEIASVENDGIKRGKRLSLEDTSQLVLLVGVTPAASPGEFQITVELYPVEGQIHLPRSLHLMILDTAGQVVLQADGSNSEGLEFQFSAETKERFTVQIQWQDLCIEEVFEI